MEAIINRTELNWIITSKETVCQTIEQNNIDFPFRYVSRPDDLYISLVIIQVQQVH
ncbi:hypothetical protein KOY_02518 [Bacillus cereus VDM021]|nr:hypothetical protein IIW_01419 [Bacillus cereus VD136]EOP73373.1 hypothetical protein KOW_00783 [Bacillus cereus VDM006]EOQ08305.1 hypothetical protein KOY_02518 [Bacillus cereus VDM021]